MAEMERTRMKVWPVGGARVAKWLLALACCGAAVGAYASAPNDLCRSGPHGVRPADVYVPMDSWIYPAAAACIRAAGSIPVACTGNFTAGSAGRGSQHQCTFLPQRAWAIHVCRTGADAGIYQQGLH